MLSEWTKKLDKKFIKPMSGTAKVAGSGTAATTMDLQTALYWLNLSKKKRRNFRSRLYSS